jgi:hypothetical protein
MPLISDFHDGSNIQLFVLIPYILDMEAPSLSIINSGHVDPVAQDQVYKLPSHPEELEVNH